MVPIPKMTLRVLLFLLVAALFAGAAGAAEPFATPRPGRIFKFPADHGAHPDFKTEWWYWVGHLKSSEGEAFGYQLTFFRTALRRPDALARSAWSLNTVYFAHLAVTDPARGRFRFREKVGRGALGLAGATPDRLHVWIGDWQARQEGEGFHLEAGDQGLGLDLHLTPRKPPALHGEGGFSPKSAHDLAASYYYSITRLASQGHLFLDGRALKVSGASWMDHEFFSGSMAPDQVGWDWFAIQLQDGSDLMLYLLRRRDGSLDSASAGTLVDPQGQTRHLKLADFQVKASGVWKSPHSGAVYPAGWQVLIPGAGLELTLTPTLADQEIRAGVPAQVSYWEGQVRVQGRAGARPLSGMGYVELTGYAGAMEGRF